jgi:glycosyltransferase involved in cell wall biosynthesis
LSPLKPFVFIRYKKNATLLNEYKKYSKVFFLEDIYNVSKLFDLWSAFWNAFFISFINNKRRPIIFFWNEYFIRSLIPNLNEKVILIDIIHNTRPLNNDNYIYLNNDIASRLNKRVVINAYLKDVLRNQYNENKIPFSLLDKVTVINNAVQVMRALAMKKKNAILQVIYVSRPAIEKRVHLIGKIAARCRKMNIVAEFNIIGDLENLVDEDNRKYCTFYGEVKDEKKINQLYSENDIILLVSESEGFPLVVAEAMAQGLVPITTDVGGIKYHIKNGENGFLTSANDEETVIAEFIRIINNLASNRNKLELMSLNAYDYAKKNFSFEEFKESYRRLFNL